jgi:hypothetical protein
MASIQAKLSFGVLLEVRDEAIDRLHARSISFR